MTIAFKTSADFIARSTEASIASSREISPLFMSWVMPVASSVPSASFEKAENCFVLKKLVVLILP
jgi:hypothetical protein